MRPTYSCYNSKPKNVLSWWQHNSWILIWIRIVRPNVGPTTNDTSNNISGVFIPLYIFIISIIITNKLVLVSRPENIMIASRTLIVIDRIGIQYTRSGVVICNPIINKIMMKPENQATRSNKCGPNGVQEISGHIWIAKCINIDRIVGIRLTKYLCLRLCRCKKQTEENNSQ